MRETVELHIAAFKADILWLRSEPAMFSQVEKRLQNQVEVLKQWADVHESIFEKYQDEKSFSFTNVLAKSDTLASVFTALIALNANHNNVRHANSVISFSGLGKLDLILNETKTKVLKSISMLLNFIFMDMSNEEAQMAPMISKLILLLPHLIDSIALFAMEPNLNNLLLQESNSELVVALIDILVVVSD
jgi:hypothetical protein